MLLASIMIPASLAGTAGLLREMPLRVAAAAVDQRCDLKDRVVSALEFSEKPWSPERQLQMEDAVLHLRSVRARDVVTLRIPRHAGWAVGMILAGVTAIVIPASASRPDPVSDVSATSIGDAQRIIEAELDDLDAVGSETDTPELQELVKKLREDLAQLNESGVDARQSLSTISEMQQKMRDLAAELDTTAVDARLADVADAMERAKAFQRAASALKNQQFSEAAEALENADTSDLKETETRPMSEKLAETAAVAEEEGLSKLSESLDDLSQSVRAMDDAAIEQNAEILADQIRRHEIKKKLSNTLKARSEALAKSKKLLAADSNSEGNGASANARGTNLEKGRSERKTSGSSRKAGSKSSGNIAGDKTKLDGELQMAELTGKLGASGDSETEKVRTASSEEQATRLAQETFARYQRMSQAILEGEPIPHGQRRTVQRYFELIRPSVESDATSSDSQN